MAASPQNPDPRDRNRDNLHPIGEARRVDREVGGGMRYGWTWIWIWLLILAFIICVVWFGGWGWAGHGGWWWGNHHYARVVQQPVANVNGPGVAVLNATNKQPFIGLAFNVRSVPVQTVVNDHAVWIGENNGASMLVVLTGANDTVTNANIAQGDRVNVIGTVQKAPAAAQATRQWSLTSDDTSRLEQQGAYIQATEVVSGQP